MSVCNPSLYARVLESTCRAGSDGCDSGTVLVGGHCVPPDRRLDYLRCQQARGCIGATHELCTSVDDPACAAEALLCADFDYEGVLRLTRMCGDCAPAAATTASADALAPLPAPPAAFGFDTVDPRPTVAASGSGAEASATEVERAWRDLALAKVALAADLLAAAPEAPTTLQHEGATRATFARVAAPLAAPAVEALARVALPVATAYDDVCCTTDAARTLPEVITPAFVEAEYARQLAFGGIRCDNAACGPPPAWVIPE